MMNSRGAWLSGQEQNHSPVQANDPRSHRLPQRFFTVLQNSERQEDLSACPSIENELPNLAIKPLDLRLQHLIGEIQLKDRALRKATMMINLLKQENRQLSSQIVLLQAQVSGKQKTIDQLIESIDSSCRIAPSEAITLTQPHAFATTSRSNHKRKSKSELFQEYTQPKLAKQKLATTTLYPSMAKAEPQLLLTKQLTPYLPQQHRETWSTLQEIASKTIEEEISNNKELIRSIEELLEAEDQVYFQKKTITTEQIKQIEESPQIFCITPNIQQSSDVVEILRQYRKIVEIYRQYSAYLRSYLCQLINFVSQTVEQSYPSMNLTKLIKLVKTRLSQVMFSGLQQVRVQNKQLKAIIQELIRNWQLARQKQSLSSCPICSTIKAESGMKQLQ